MSSFMPFFFYSQRLFGSAQYVPFFMLIAFKNNTDCTVTTKTHAQEFYRSLFHCWVADDGMRQIDQPARLAQFAPVISFGRDCL